MTIPAYLIGLGLFRVTAHMDMSTRAVWESDDAIHLIRKGTIIDERNYLLHAWHPTPITRPWSDNGYDGSVAKLIESIEQSDAARLREYREAIIVGRAATLAPKDKLAIMRHYRNHAPESALDFVDACLAELPGERVIYNPVFGSGGNDARLDFSRSYMAALEKVIHFSTGHPTAESAYCLDHLLGLTDATSKSPIKGVPGGQFFGGDTNVNPWAFILAMEGCMLFGGGNWRMDAEMPRWPNSASLTTAGYPSASDTDEGEEMWWPIWRSPINYTEARELLSNQILKLSGGEHPLVGAMCAVASRRQNDLEFLRVGRLVRNGLSHLLTPLGNF